MDYLGFLIESDKSGAYWPEKIDFGELLPKLRERLELLARDVEREFGEPTRCSGIPQDGAFHGSFTLREIPGVGKPIVVASNFGDMITILGEHVLAEAELIRLKELFRERGYFFIPQEIRNMEYCGSLEWVKSWTHRFFSHL
jgi:hypothetical protein